MSLLIRRARPDEAGLVLSLVRELAEYEKLLHEVEATEAMIADALFGANPRVFCDIAELDGEMAGFAVWFVIPQERGGCLWDACSSDGDFGLRSGLWASGRETRIRCSDDKANGSSRERRNHDRRQGRPGQRRSGTD